MILIKMKHVTCIIFLCVFLFLLIQITTLAQTDQRREKPRNYGHYTPYSISLKNSSYSYKKVHQNTSTL